ncbi:MAG: DJ-1/PfpI family protein [Deltaproteobacteria bacterium]|nr:DJ-1/PfpI family protein [Deltaproteobacteria bacterium]
MIFMRSIRPLPKGNVKILITAADVLRGCKVTGWKSIIQDIKNAGATFVDAAVVEDGNLISRRHPVDLPEFIRASLRKLEGGIR